ncbi:restriction endonuclease subunit S [Neptuniibacter pectenicola]|jgi:type I restriction enzyme S subunit|uniref:restriction endonuclease subunit S n=1 Tax=Neptuniibacter pectenicola TaxID=1806669 RepID=UPI0030EBCD90|tara:strand:- start:1205 stop:2569 length:1365 start_codon:yes stop_codon:yes gene_type:complete
MTETYQEYAYSEYFRTALPAHWNIKKLSLIADQTRNGFVDGPFGSDLKSNEYQDSGVPLIQLNNIRDGQHVLRNMKFITQEKKQQLSRHIALPRDVVIAKMADPVARAAIVEKVYDEYVIVADCVKLSPDLSKIDLAFLVWAINSDAVRINAELASTGTTRIRINLAELKKLKIPYPSIIEQQQIANFLDHETAKIDTLIDKQQQLIKLLKEKRQAVISHAVTKGLNPDAPMKDSGVEWLGEVPEYWNTKRISLLYKESSVRAAKAEELAYPILSVSIHHGISDKELDEAELDRKVTRSDDKSLYKVVERNDLAYNMMRAWQGGFGASKLSGLISPAYVVCKPLTVINSKYFELVLRTPNAIAELKRYSRGITDFRLRLYWDEFKNIHIPVPPSDEVDAILEKIIEIESKYKKIEISAQQQIKLLTERRTALISAAVTGKIDVRNFKAGDTHVA